MDYACLMLNTKQHDNAAKQRRKLLQQ